MPRSRGREKGRRRVRQERIERRVRGRAERRRAALLGHALRVFAADGGRDERTD